MILRSFLEWDAVYSAVTYGVYIIFLVSVLMPINIYLTNIMKFTIT